MWTRFIIDAIKRNRVYTVVVLLIRQPPCIHDYVLLPLCRQNSIWTEWESEITSRKKIQKYRQQMYKPEQIRWFRSTWEPGNTHFKTGMVLSSNTIDKNLHQQSNQNGKCIGNVSYHSLPSLKSIVLFKKSSLSMNSTMAITWRWT